MICLFVFSLDTGRKRDVPPFEALTGTPSLSHSPLSYILNYFLKNLAGCAEEL